MVLSQVGGVQLGLFIAVRLVLVALTLCSSKTFEHVHAKKSENQGNFEDAGHLCMPGTNHRAHDRLFLSGPLSPVTRGRCALSFLQFSCGPGGFLLNRNIPPEQRSHRAARIVHPASAPAAGFRVLPLVRATVDRCVVLWSGSRS